MCSACVASTVRVRWVFNRLRPLPITNLRTSNHRPTTPQPPQPNLNQPPNRHPPQKTNRLQVVDANFVHEKFTPGRGRGGHVRDALVVATPHKVFSLAGAEDDE